MNKQNRKLLPFRVYTEDDVLNEFSLSTTGDFGQFVKISRGDLNDIQGQVADSFGAAFDGVVSPWWGIKSKVAPVTSGDTKYEAVGVTLKSTLLTDENGEPLKFYRQKLDELNGVLSGEAVPVIGKGRFSLGPDGYTVTGGAPTRFDQASVGDLVVISNFNDGQVDIVPAAWVSPNTGTPPNNQYSEDQVVGKVLATGEYDSGGSVYISLNV